MAFENGFVVNIRKCVAGPAHKFQASNNIMLISLLRFLYPIRRQRAATRATRTIEAYAC